MSEATPELPATEAVETPATPVPDMSAIDASPFGQAIRINAEMANVLCAQANAIASQLKAVGNVGKIVSEIRDNSDDEKVVRFREFKTQLLAKLDEAERTVDAHIKASLMPSTDGLDVEAAKAAYAPLAAQVKALHTVVGTFAAQTPAGGVPEGLLTGLLTLKGTQSKASNGESGIRRPRISEITVNGESVFEEKKNEDGTVKHVSNLTVLKLWLDKKYKGHGYTVPVIQDLMFGAAGTEDISTLEGKPFDFTLALKGEGQPTVTVNVTPTYKS